RLATTCRSRGAVLVVDNTTATPLGLQPLSLGADLVVASATKALSGHSDLLAGYVAGSHPALLAAVERDRLLAGPVLGTFEAWLVLRSLGSAGLRIDRQCRNAQAVALMLRDHPAVRAVRDPGADATQDGMARHYLVEESGHVVVATGEGEQAQVPLHAVIRPTSSLALDVPPAGLTVGTSATTANLTFTGQTLGTPGADPTAAVAMVSPLELVWTNPAAPPSRDRFGVIRWLGVTSDAPQRGGVANATVFFGLAVHGPWPSPRDVDISIGIDTNQDRVPEWRLATTDYGAIVSRGEENPRKSDVFGAELSNPLTSEPLSFVTRDRVPPGTGAMSVFGTEVMVLALPASALGLTDQASQFDFTVGVSLPNSTRSSTSPTLTYDVARPGLSPANGMPPLPLAPGQPLPVRVDRQALTGRGSGGLLLLVHSNPSGARAAAVPVTFADCTLDPCPAVTTTLAPSTRTVTLRVAETPACSPVTYAWDFGDGSPAGSGATATHSYERPGTYTWHLTVRASGQSCSSSGALTLRGVVRRRLPRG
ncbi:MAG TPA: PLP-dependent transferase, partial [Thermoanaerobaculaceae bacterium]|nr:PLP-dependent transferase [Thermoanaerobaculaceae bacterium]